MKPWEDRKPDQWLTGQTVEEVKVHEDLWNDGVLTVVVVTWVCKSAKIQ